MKLTRLSTVYLCIATSLTVALHAQGKATYNFSNYVPGEGLDAPIFNADGSRLEGSRYLAMLYVGEFATSLEPILPAVPFQTGSLAAGYFLGGTRESEKYNANTTLFVEVRVWSTAVGSNYEEASTSGLGGHGKSKTLHVTSGGLSIPPSPLRGLESFSLLPIIPEPTTIALLIVGTIILVAKARRELRN